MEVFQDYRRMSWKHSDDQHRIYKNQNMDIDISMFPSPHQIVPSLFPGDAHHPGYGDSVHNASGLPFGMRVIFLMSNEMMVMLYGLM